MGAKIKRLGLRRKEEEKKKKKEKKNKINWALTQLTKPNFNLGF
jgi:hypothetical protein